MLTHLPVPVHIEAVELRIDVIELQWVRVIAAVHGVHHAHEHNRRCHLTGCALYVIVHLAVKNSGRHGEVVVAEVQAKFDLSGHFRVQVDITSIRIAVRQTGGGFQWEPQVAFLVAWGAVFLGDASVPGAVVAGGIPGFGDQVDIIVGLIAVGVVERVAQHLCRRHYHGWAAVHFVCIHLDPVIAQSELTAPLLAEILLPFQEGAENLPLGAIEVFNEKHRVIGIIYIGVVFRAEAVETENPGALLVR